MLPRHGVGSRQTPSPPTWLPPSIIKREVFWISKFVHRVPFKILGVIWCTGLLLLLIITVSVVAFYLLKPLCERWLVYHSFWYYEDQTAFWTEWSHVRIRGTERQRVYQTSRNALSVAISTGSYWNRVEEEGSLVTSPHRSVSSLQHFAILNKSMKCGVCCISVKA